MNKGEFHFEDGGSVLRFFGHAGNEGRQIAAVRLSCFIDRKTRFIITSRSGVIRGDGEPRPVLSIGVGHGNEMRLIDCALSSAEVGIPFSVRSGESRPKPGDRLLVEIRTKPNPGYFHW
ncbi:MAG: hypothetical protein ABIH90_02150 [Candidatus Aenigmatarchaeota archaeon]